MTYDGSKPAIIHLQMIQMCWYFDITHITNDWIVKANYWYRLEADLYFEPLFHNYIHKSINIRINHPFPESFPMQPSNIPDYRGPLIAHTGREGSIVSANNIDVYSNNLILSIIIYHSHVHVCLENFPLSFGTFDQLIYLDAFYKSTPLYNINLPLAANKMLQL